MALLASKVNFMKSTFVGYSGAVVQNIIGMEEKDWKG